MKPPKHPKSAPPWRQDKKAAASLGGKARAANMTPEQRSEAARNAVTARWARRLPVVVADTRTASAAQTASFVLMRPAKTKGGWVWVEAA